MSKSTKSRDNRAAAQKAEFNPLVVQANTIDTIVKLLNIKEPEILKSAIISLNRHAMKSSASALELVHLDIVPLLLKLLYEQNTLEILRFTLKLFALLIKQEDVTNMLREDLQFAVKIASFLVQIPQVSLPLNDELIHEYASTILAVLTEEKPIATELIEFGLLQKMWQHIECAADADTLNAAIKVILNLLQLPNIINLLTTIPTFNFEPLFNHFTSPYIEIQTHSLQLVDEIIHKADDTDVFVLIAQPTAIPPISQSLFIEKLLAVLDNPLYVDTHRIVLDILREMFYWHPTVEFFLEKEYLPFLLKFIENNVDVGLEVLCLDIITNIAKTENGRQELYILCIDKYLLELLQNNHHPLKACEAIKELCKHPKVVQIFTDPTTVELIVGYLLTKPTDLIESGGLWESDRNHVIDILTYLIWADPRVPDNIVQTSPQLFNIMLETLQKNSFLMPVEYFCKFLYLFQAFAVCKAWYSCVFKTHLFDSLIGHLHVAENDDRIKITVLDVLSSYMCAQLPVDWCLHSRCYLDVLKFLNSPNKKLVFATVRFLNQLCKHKNVAYLYLKHNLVSLLQKQSKEFEYYPLWQQTLDYLYSIHLPSKFNNLGYLNITDITQNHFYVARNKMPELPILEDLLELNVSPLHTIYVSTFQYKRPPLKQLEVIFGNNEEVNGMMAEFIRSYTENNIRKQYKPCKYPNATTSICSMRVDKDVQDDDAPSTATKVKTGGEKAKGEKRYMLYRPLDEFIQTRYREAGNERKTARVETPPEIPSEVAFKEIAPRLMSWLGRLPPDPYMIQYLNEIRNIFNTDLFLNGNLSLYLKLIQRVEFLAKFVVACTSGPTKGNTYLTEQAQLDHLNRLKFKYFTNLIQLGFVRIGSYLERSMLFKVLADRLQIPCRFLRGDFGRAWNEVPLIVGSIELACGIETDSPIVYYVVDLMNNPGQLYPVESKMALDYITFHG